MADNSSTSSFNPKRLAIRVLLFSVAAVASDQFVGLFLGTLHERTREGDFGGCVNLTLEQRNDVVVFGSSRAKHHYVPDVLEETTGRSFFNAGIDAQDILCHYGIAQLVLDEYSPKAFVLDLNPEDLRDTGRAGALDKLSILLPYYERGNEPLNSLLLERSKFERLKLLSASYPYNSMLLPLVKYNLKPGSAGTIASRGFLAYTGSDLEKILAVEKVAEVDAEYVPPSIDAFRVGVLREFIQSAREKGVQVVVCLGPLWEKKGVDRADHDVLLSAYVKLLEELDVPLVRVDGSTDEAFLDPALYKDRIHINKSGAFLFSRLLGERLGPLLAHESAVPAASG